MSDLAPLHETWRILATVALNGPDGQVMRQIPTFDLDGDLHGIMGAGHAELIALAIIDPLRRLAQPEASVAIRAYLV